MHYLFSRKFIVVALLVLAAISFTAVAAQTSNPIVSDSSECGTTYPNTTPKDIGDGNYECEPATTNTEPPPTEPDPCTTTSGEVGAAGDPCNTDPCSIPGGEVGAASDPCQEPDPCTNPSGINGRVDCNTDPCSKLAGISGRVNCNPDPCLPQTPFPFGDVEAAGAPANCAPVVAPAPAYNPPAEPGNPGQISFNDSDLGVALVQTQDSSGNAVLEVYDMHNQTTNGNYMFSITQDDLAPFAGNPPAENTLLHAEGHVAVYVLSTGEIQMNVGPDSEGKIHVKIFDAIPWTRVYGYVIEPA